MSKIKKIILLILIVIFIVVTGFLFGKQDKTEETNGNVGQLDDQQQIDNGTNIEPTLSFSEIPQNEKIEINEVQVNNFFTGSEVTENKANVEIEVQDDYAISYLNRYNLFTIVVLESPFFQKRIQAENRFLSELGISQEEACQLNVDITTPNFVNPDESGEVYGLSFCE